MVRLILLLALVSCADSESASDEQLFEAWVPYTTGSAACPALESPAVEHLAAVVRAGNLPTLEPGPSALCAIAHLVEDAGGVNRGHDGDQQGNEHPCHGMGPEHRRLLRQVLAAARL